MPSLLMTKEKECVRCGSQNDLARVILDIEHSLDGNPPAITTGHACSTCRHYVEFERSKAPNDSTRHSRRDK